MFLEIMVINNVVYRLSLAEGYATHFMQGWRQEFSKRGADSSDEGAKIQLSGYCKCQKSPTK